MTREEFLTFDTSKFYEPGYEQDRDFMSFFTGLFIAAMTDSDAKYKNAKKNNNKTIDANRFQLWLLSNENVPINKIFKSACPQGPFKCKEFFEEYEYYLKHFIRAYHNQIAEITENKSNYYFFERYKQDILGKIFYQYSGDDLLGVNPCDLFMEKKGFCDLRYITAFSFKNNDPTSSLVEKSYDDTMADCRDSFFDSTVRLINNFAEKTDRTKN